MTFGPSPPTITATLNDHLKVQIVKGGYFYKISETDDLLLLKAKISNIYLDIIQVGEKI